MRFNTVIYSLGLKVVRASGIDLFDLLLLLLIQTKGDSGRRDVVRGVSWVSLISVQFEPSPSVSNSQAGIIKLGFKNHLVS